MLFFLLACASQTPQSTPSAEEAKTVPIPKKQIPPPDERAPKPITIDTSINSSAQKISHPSVPQKRVSVDVCDPYYTLLTLESQRGTAQANEEKRIKTLRALNRTLEYHPENTAQAIVELEKEVFAGPIHLSIELRQTYWQALHSYIGSICRADLSNMNK